MNNEILTLLIEQEKGLNKLLKLLKDQYSMAINKDVFSLEDLSSKIKEESKNVARFELERRKLMGTQRVGEYITKHNDNQLNEVYEQIKSTLAELENIKKTNEMLFKQKIGFNTKMLTLLNPNREIKTYNSYGNLKR